MPSLPVDEGAVVEREVPPDEPAALQRGPFLQPGQFDDDELRTVIRDEVFSPDQVETYRYDDFESVRRYFTDKEVVDLTYAVAAIDAWNRLAIAFRSEPGSYQRPHARAGHAT